VSSSLLGFLKKLKTFSAIEPKKLSENAVWLDNNVARKKQLKNLFFIKKNQLFVNI
jgi:hypothetical protein